MRRALLAILLGTLVTARALAGDDAGTESPLTLGAGSRALALGRTGAAFAAGADALFWNSARLGLVEHAGLSLFRTDLFAEDAAYNAGFLAYPSLDSGTFGIGFQRLGVSGIERRDERNQLLGSFEESESSLLVGYGRRFGGTLALGTALRLVQQSVDAASDASVGLDLGATVEQPIGRGDAHRLGLGINLQNILRPQLRLGGEEVPDPRSVKLGAAYVLVPGAGRLTWLVAADLDLPERAGVRLGAGVEMTYRGLLALRVGVDGSAPTFGFGFAWRNLHLDYALVDRAGLDRGDRISLDIRLGHSVSERRLARETARERLVSEALARQLEQREAEERARAHSEAEAAFGAGRFEDALRAYRRVLALAPEDTLATARADTAERELALANAAGLSERGAVGEAAAAYQSILDRWPAEARAAGALAEARAALQRTADRGRQVNDLLKQALAAFAQNDPIAADGALQELLRLDPSHEVALELASRVQAGRAAAGEQALARARAAADRRDYGTALERLSEARRHLGSRPELAALAAEWTKAGSEPSRTEDTVSRPPEPRPPAVVRHPSPTAQQRAELDRRYHDGLEAFGRGDFQGAIRSWHTVWVEWPDHPSVAGHLIKAHLCEGVALYSSGKYAAAIEHCKRVLDIDPANAKAKRYLQRMVEERSELQQIGDPDGRE